MAFCPPCAQRNWWATFRDAQFLRGPHAIEHVTEAGGLLWYVPKEPGPPSALRLAALLEVQSVYALLPIGIDGHAIEPPVPTNVQALRDADDAYNHLPAGPKPDHKST